MNKKISNGTILAALLGVLSCSSRCALPAAAPPSDEVFLSSSDLGQFEMINAPDVIFSNLDPVGGARYNSDPYFAFELAGKRAGDNQTESEYAVPFTPREDVQATVLAAAITYVSGDRLVTLGIYTDDDGTVGELLPGGEGATSEIPDPGECCQLAKVTLPEGGVALSAGTRYWLVAGADNVSGPTFHGKWQFSNRAASAYLQPPFPWNPQAGAWPAALVRGFKKMEGTRPAKALTIPKSSPELSAADGSVIVFKNLASAPEDPYIRTLGVQVNGNDVPFRVEGWQALPFTPRANVHAKVLGAAIGYISGTKKVNLGIYADKDGLVGDPLPGGQGSTTDIPDSGDCCEFTKVRLQGAGVALAAGTQYWLVASPDNVNAPDFEGEWHYTNLAVGASQEPEHFVPWENFYGAWLAAEISGTLP